jgi:hypothetical protein
LAQHTHSASAADTISIVGMMNFQNFRTLLNEDKDFLEIGDLLEEEFQDTPYYSKRGWPEELVTEKYQIMPDKKQ